MTADQYRNTRKQLGLTQTELAARLGVSVMTVKRRENGGTITHEAELAIKALKPKS